MLFTADLLIRYGKGQKMAKRFIDTELFEDEWFSELSTDAKLLWIYYITRCNHAGLLKFNKRLIEFQTGIKNIERVFEQLGNRLIRVSEVLYFCPKFIEFQYPNFPNSQVRQQNSAIKLLLENNINPETLTVSDTFNSIETVSKDLTKSYEYEHVYEHGGSKEKKIDFEVFWNLYPNKVAKSKCLPKWNKLSIEEQQKAIDTLPKFVLHKPFPSYTHPNPETYLNQKRWEDVLVTPTSNNRLSGEGVMESRKGFAP